jgi:hypothetical protein
VSWAEAGRSLRRVLVAVRLLLTVQRRSGFLHVYLGVAVATILAIRFGIPASWYPYAVPALLLGEYGTMGVFMTGAHRYLERIEGSNVALVVTPLTPAEQTAAMILAPALVATAAGSAVQIGVLGFDARALLLVPPLFLTAVLAGITGIVLSSRCREFTGFIIASVPVTTLFSLPYLSFFGAVPRWSFVWLPWDASLFSFGNLARPEPVLRVWGLLLAVLLLFVIPGSLWAERSFRLNRRQELL